MKHSYLRHILLCLCLLAGIAANAYDAEINGIYYNFSGNEAEVTYQKRYNPDYTGAVNIPSVVGYNGKSYRVTSIGTNAFYGCSSLTSVYIPNSVNSIGETAFYGCSSLTSVTIPDNLTYIGWGAFEGTPWYKTLHDNMPNGLIYIGKVAYEYKGTMPAGSEIIIREGTTMIVDMVFAGCRDLTSVTIPSSVTSIGGAAFENCEGLTEVHIKDIAAWCNITFHTSFYGIYNPLRYAHHLYLYDTEIKQLVIPNGVTRISNDAFYGCSGLTSVTIPESVTSIGENAFYDCSGLTSVTIPENVTYVGGNAFYGTPWYNNKSNGLMYLGKVAYKYKGTMPTGTNIIIREGTTMISGFAFDGCGGLTSITIPSSVTSIGRYAFRDCSSLTSIAIPESVTSIEGSAFYGCYCLTEVHINDIAAWCNINFAPGYMSNFSANPLSIANHLYINGSEVKQLVIPNGVTRISDNVFYGCSGLTSVKIPENVTSIGANAFCECSNLISVKMERESPVTIGSSTFSNRTNAVLYVPIGSKAAYKAADYWKDFSEIIEYANEKIYINEIEGVIVKQLVLPIALKNKQQITGLQMDLYLPEGMTVAKNSRGKPMISVTDRMDGNYTVTGHEMEGGFVRIAGLSPDTDAFAGNDGDILNVTVDIDESLPSGKYVIGLKNIVLSDVYNQEYHPDDTEITVRVYGQGDADGSGAVNINDAVCIVNHILKRDTGTFLEKAADVDGSGSININDVVVLIDRFILHRYNAPLHTSRMMADATDIADQLYLDDLDIMAGETAEVVVKLSNTHEVRAVQGNIKLPEGFAFVTKSNGQPDVKNLNVRSEDFTLSCAIQEDGSITFTQYSIDGYSYEGNDGGIFTFKITADEGVLTGAYKMAVTDVVLSINGVPYEQSDFFSSIVVIPDGIEDISVDNVTKYARYDLQGRQIENGKLLRGINIIRYSDSTTRKVLVK